jgi:glycerophosphoryl diester phosphodiesterase
MLIFAHRGASAYAPENTFAAFERALELGADGIETDVRLTADGVLVLLHDDTVDRTTDGRGPIAELRWPEAELLDAGSWFGPEFTDEHIPRLDAFIERYLGRLRLCLEVKAWEAGEPLVQVLRDRGLNEHPTLDVTTFSWDGILQLRAALPHLTLGWLTVEMNSAILHKVAAAGLAQICPLINSLTPEMVSGAHFLGLEVRTWGISNRADLQRAIEAGVDGTTLNWPDWRTHSPS